MSEAAGRSLSAQPRAAGAPGSPSQPDADGDLELVLVRHAETAWSLSGQHTGRTDLALTDTGREVARGLRGPLRGFRPARVLVSPLARARETCLLAGLDAHAEVRDELTEWDYGSYEGRTTRDIRRERPDWDLWRDGSPGGESAAAVGARVDSLLADLAQARGSVAVFSHGHVLRVLGARWVGLEAAAGALLALSTGAISVLGHERERRVLWRWNEQPTPDRDLGAEPLVRAQVPPEQAHL